MIQPGMAVTADLVSMDRYDCSGPAPSKGLIKGLVLPPMAIENLVSTQVELAQGYWSAKLAQIPAALRKKELEGNLVILYHGKIAYYSNFLDIPQSALGLLPIGLFSDSLMQVEDTSAGILHKYPIIFERQARLVIPFRKGHAYVDRNFIARALDSLGLRDASISSMDIRAYASVEGSEAVNTRLIDQRVKAVATAILLFQPKIASYTYRSGEDWLEFNQALTRSPWSRYARLRKGDMKIKLLDRGVADSLEGMLASERKAVVTFSYLRRTGFQGVAGDSIKTAFQRAVARKQIREARLVIKEIYERIRDNSLPNDYLNRLEVPQSVDFWELQSDKATYSYWLRFFDEREALEAFEKITAINPTAGSVNYNIAALKLVLWHGAVDTIRDTVGLLASIGQLAEQGIDPSLVRRISVNYFILLTQDYMAKLNYERKDSALAMVRKYYDGVPLTDADRYALARFFSFYSQQDWSMELILPRIDQLDVSLDLLFYYINLAFFKPADYGSDRLREAMLNAANLDRTRFCQLFHSTHIGGAGMQLLEEPVFREFFCEDCRTQ